MSDVPWRIELLGGLRLWRDGVALPEVTQRKSGELLGYLAYHASQSHRRDALITLLWPDSEQADPGVSLRVLLTRLKERLGPDLPIRIERQTLQWMSSQASVDVTDFEQLARRGRLDTSPPQRQQALEEATVLYQGKLLPRLDASWVVAARFRLESLHSQLRLQLALTLEEQGRFDEAMLCVERVLEADELREDAHQALLRLLMRRGDHGAAHRHYERLTRLLRDRLQSLPSPATRAVLLSPPLSSSTPPPSVDALPTPLTSFFGRKSEMEELQALIQNGKRLVTIVGPGGVGKTRFSIEAVRPLAWSRALYWAPLADLSPGAALEGAVLGLLSGRSPEQGVAPEDALVRLFQSAPSLLILDNLEHLDDAQLYPLVQILLRRVPSLTILATSRRPLHLDGEQLFPLAPLPTPTTDALSACLASESVRLFTDRARLIRPEFALTDENAADLAALCRRLDGLPLAIEMAAARLRVMTVGEVLRRLSESQHFLTNRDRSAPARHASMHAALAWSVDQLPQEIRAFLTDLAVFRSDFTAAWAASLTERLDAHMLLEQLCDLSLVVPVDSSRGSRFRLLETVREFLHEIHSVSEERIAKWVAAQIDSWSISTIQELYPLIKKATHYFLNQKDEYKLQALFKKLKHIDIENTQIFDYLITIKEYIPTLNENLLSYILTIASNISLKGNIEKSKKIISIFTTDAKNFSSENKSQIYFAKFMIASFSNDFSSNDYDYYLNLIEPGIFRDLILLNIASHEERLGNTFQSIQMLDTLKNKEDIIPIIQCGIYCQLSMSYSKIQELDKAAYYLNKAKSLPHFSDSNHCNISATEIIFLYNSNIFKNCIDLCLSTVNRCFNLKYDQLFWIIFEFIGLSLIKLGEPQNGIILLGLAESEMPPVPVQRTGYEKERVRVVREPILAAHPELIADWEWGRSLSVREGAEKLLRGEIPLL